MIYGCLEVKSPAASFPFTFVVTYSPAFIIFVVALTDFVLTPFRPGRHATACCAAASFRPQFATKMEHF